MKKHFLKKSPKFKTFIVVLFISLLCPLVMWGQTLGDVNNSGTPDIVDALVIAQYYVGLNPTGFNPAMADVNGDGAITIIDALIIAQYYVGLITEFPAGSQTTPAPATGDGTTSISLNGNSISVTGTGATVSGSTVTITTAAVEFNVSGSRVDREPRGSLSPSEPGLIVSHHTAQAVYYLFPVGNTSGS